MRMNEANFEEILTKIRSNDPTLETLGLEHQDIGGQCCIKLADALKENKALKKLDLKDNNIGNAGAIAIAGALKINKALEELDLAHNEIGNEGAIAIADSLENNVTLKYIRLNNSNNELASKIEAITERNKNMLSDISKLLSEMISNENSTKKFSDPQIKFISTSPVKNCVRILEIFLQDVPIEGIPKALQKVQNASRKTGMGAMILSRVIELQESGLAKNRLNLPEDTRKFVKAELLKIDGLVNLLKARGVVSKTEFEEQVLNENSPTKFKLSNIPPNEVKSYIASYLKKDDIKISATTNEAPAKKNETPDATNVSNQAASSLTPPPTSRTKS